MWEKQLLVLATLVTSCPGLQDVTVTSSFRRLGSLATGLSYAHIHGEIDFRGLQQAQQAVTSVLIERLQKSRSKEETTLVEALRPQLDIAQKTITDLQVLFFGRPIGSTQATTFFGHCHGSWSCRRRVINLHGNGSD